MKQSDFEFLSNLDTLIAVVAGALLATVGGLIGEHFEDRIERKRRERDAARFFAEILLSIDTLVDRAIQSQAIGDPWGPVTLRLFRTALREAEVYERNRERLFDLHDPELRKQIHTHVISEILPLEGMLDACERVVAITTEIDERPDLTVAKREKLAASLAAHTDSRDRSLLFIKAERLTTGSLCDALLKLARVTTAAVNPPARSP